MIFVRGIIKFCITETFYYLTKEITLRSLIQIEKLACSITTGSESCEKRGARFTCSADEMLN